MFWIIKDVCKLNSKNKYIFAQIIKIKQNKKLY